MYTVHHSPPVYAPVSKVHETSKNAISTTISSTTNGIIITALTATQTMPTF